MSLFSTTGTPPSDHGAIFVINSADRSFVFYRINTGKTLRQVQLTPKCRGGGLLPYMGYIGMCRCEGYGFEAVYSRIGYINGSVWV